MNFSHQGGGIFMREEILCLCKGPKLSFKTYLPLDFQSVFADHGSMEAVVWPLGSMCVDGHLIHRKRAEKELLEGSAQGDCQGD